MSGGRRVSNSIKERIEQAVARGHSHEQICTDLDVDATTVNDVIAAMDKVAAIKDVFTIKQRIGQGQDVCRNGHPLDPENTYVKPSNGKRECRICKTARNKRPRQHGAA